MRRSWSRPARRRTRRQRSRRSLRCRLAQCLPRSPGRGPRSPLPAQGRTGYMCGILPLPGSQSVSAKRPATASARRHAAATRRSSTRPDSTTTSKSKQAPANNHRKACQRNLIVQATEMSPEGDCVEQRVLVHPRIPSQRAIEPVARARAPPLLRRSARLPARPPSHPPIIPPRPIVRSCIPARSGSKISCER